MEAITRSLAAMLAAVLVAGTAGGQVYEVIDLGTLGGATSTAVGLSPDGDVAGRAQLTSGAARATVWTNEVPMDLGVPDGFTTSAAVDVASDGRAVGYGERDPQALGAYLWETGAWRELGTLGGQPESLPSGINDAGQVVAYSFTLGQADERTYLWEDGVLTDLGTLEGGSTRGRDINELGSIVGGSRLASGDSHAFLWEEGTMTDLGVLAGEDSSVAFGLNESGDIVGTSWHLMIPSMLTVEQATLWRGGEILDLGLVPGPLGVCSPGVATYPVSVARAVNNWGTIVGDARCITSGSARAAWIWRDGVMENLNDLVGPSGWDLQSARDVNDDGWITGHGIAPGGDLHAFLLKPLEPIEREERACDDGIDNDGDGPVDCADDDCTGESCDDAVACTTGDVCVDGGCAGTPEDALCDDGAFCNGAESCDVAAGCLAGEEPCADPGERCEEATRSCVETDCGDGVDNDGDGQADCADDDCAGESCDDGVACTTGDVCVDGGCAGTPEDALCDDGAFCNGAETCDVAAGCLSGEEPCADPGERCEEAARSCVETDCQDGVDNDGDEAADCADDDCAVDEDGDGRDAPPCGDDCDDADDTAWCAPAEVRGLLFEDGRTIIWTGLDETCGPGLRYQVLRGALDRLPVGGAGESCLGEPSGTTFEDPSPRDAALYYYLVRGRNACTLAEGGWGFDSSGGDRRSSACP